MKEFQVNVTRGVYTD